MTWSDEELSAFERAEELRVASIRADGTRRRAVPIWVVRVGPHAYVRTWHRRDTGWFGHVVDAGRAHVEVPGLEREVAVTDVGADDHDLRAAIDEAYRDKYGRYGAATVARMVGNEAAAATLRLDPAPRS